MIDCLAEYLRSQRTLTASQVDARARTRARFDLTPTDRMHNACRPHATYEGARH
jgi:hypothetical protein